MFRLIFLRRIEEINFKAHPQNEIKNIMLVIKTNLEIKKNYSKV